MKRFGRILVDPRNVLAVVPMRNAGAGLSAPATGEPQSYAIHFFNGMMAIVSAADAAPLIAALVPPAPKKQEEGGPL